MKQITDMMPAVADHDRKSLRSGFFMIKIPAAALPHGLKIKDTT
jgi:hypothetical protein